ncbi:hypothetical protein P4S95_18840 [Aneurinibacillus aneurinilyticus]|nr:hypothetical protein [Aneurinibacillus aneurinilyticus]
MERLKYWMIFLLTVTCSPLLVPVPKLYATEWVVYGRAAIEFKFSR